MQELKKLKIDTIDLVVINFYPFEEAIKRNAKLKQTIDIKEARGLISEIKKRVKDLDNGKKK